MSERTRYWAVSAAWVILIYSTLYIVRPLCEWLRQYTPFNSIVWGGFAVIALWLIRFAFFHVRLKRWSSWFCFVTAIVLSLALLFLLDLPEERIHLIQYGILACFVFRALRLDLPPAAAYAGAFILSSLLGFGDEGIQYVLPNRHFDWKDVLLNSVSAGLGLLIWGSMQEERHSCKEREGTV